MAVDYAALSNFCALEKDTIYMSKRVSGCIVTFNNIKTIDNAVRTLLENTDIDLFVVDNGSTDGTPEYLEQNFPQIEVVRAPSNIGFGAGHNYILDRLNSDYHAIINPDVVIRDDIVSVMADYLDNNPDVGMLSPEIRFPDGRLQILGKLNPMPYYLVASRLRSDEPSKLLRKYAMMDQPLDKPIQIQNATGCFMFIRTSLFKEIGGFDKRYFMYFEDCDLTRQINKISKVLYFPFATVYHEWGRESKRNTKLKVIHIQSMMKYYAKWGLGDK